jgi:hypothetical protein
MPPGGLKVPEDETWRLGILILPASGGVLAWSLKLRPTRSKADSKIRRLRRPIGKGTSSSRAP